MTCTTRPARSWLLMLLPVILLGLLPWYLSRRPAQPQTPQRDQGPFRIRQVKAEHLPLTAADVARGADTKIVVKVETAGNPPQWPSSDWLLLPTIVAKKEGRIRYFHPHPDTHKLPGGSVFRGGEGGGSQGFVDGTYVANSQMIYRFRLQDVPREWGAMYFQWQTAYGPNVFPASNETESQKMAKLTRSGQALTATIRVPLRRDGETITPKRFPTDPMFDVRQIEIIPISPPIDRSDTQVVLHIFYRGKPGDDRQRQSLIAHCSWVLGDDKGESYGTATEGSFANLKGGLHRYTLSTMVDTSYARSRAKGAHHFVLRGSISVNDAWPRVVTIPIPLHPRREIKPYSGK